MMGSIHLFLLVDIGAEQCEMGAILCKRAIKLIYYFLGLVKIVSPLLIRISNSLVSVF